MEAVLNLISQSAPVIASIMAGVWIMSNKFNVVEKKCDLIAQKVDHLGEKVSDMESSKEKISSQVSSIDRRVLTLEIMKENENEKSA